jgi:hypothetical protein
VDHLAAPSGEPGSCPYRDGAALAAARPGQRGGGGEAVSGLPWVLRERRVVPPRVERGLRVLEEPQRNSKARRYVG